jgi:hypothetical protein
MLLQQTGAMETTLTAAHANLDRFETAFQTHQSTSLKQQEELLDRSTVLRSSLEDAHGSITAFEQQFQTHRSTYEDVFNSMEHGLHSIHNFHELILENLFAFKTGLFYACMVGLAYVATSTIFTARARLGLLGLIVASAAAEWQFIQMSVGAEATVDVDGPIHVFR